LDVEGVESDMVEVWFDNSYAKDFFTWVIPISETRVRCGLGTSRKNGADALKKFIKKRFNHEPEDVHAGQLCTGGPVEKTAYPGILLVGDVAGQVKPTTAGGVVIGGLCAGIAGDLTVKALETGFVHGLSEYEGLWRSRYGSDLQTMLFLRNLLNTLSDERKDRIFNAFIEENLESKLVSLVETGDMDMQADVIKRAASDAAILGALVRSAGRVALSEFLSVFGF
jgi:flavin-dependent dehydrogenase